MWFMSMVEVIVLDVVIFLDVNLTTNDPKGNTRLLEFPVGVPLLEFIVCKERVRICSLGKKVFIV
jgi:hypothetical protein